MPDIKCDIRLTADGPVMCLSSAPNPIDPTRSPIPEPVFRTFVASSWSAAWHLFEDSYFRLFREKERLELMDECLGYVRSDTPIDVTIQWATETGLHPRCAMTCSSGGPEGQRHMCAAEPYSPGTHSGM